MLLCLLFPKGIEFVGAGWEDRRIFVAGYLGRVCEEALHDFNLSDLFLGREGRRRDEESDEENADSGHD